jgi:LemA protein
MKSVSFVKNIEAPKKKRPRRFFRFPKRAAILGRLSEGESMFWVGLLALVSIVWVGISLFNRMVRLRSRIKSAHARTDAQMALRHELVPNLVENARAYLSTDRQILDEVSRAREQAVAARVKAVTIPLDPVALERVWLAEQALDVSVGKLAEALERYPDLRANEVVGTTLLAINQASAQIAHSRQYFNDVVTLYNDGLDVFPSNVLAAAFRFRPASLFARNAAA